jgi:hypothetical protein
VVAASLAAVAGTAPAASAASRVTYIGAFAGSAKQWNDAYFQIGPLQSDKVFYGTGKPPVLPTSFANSTCARLNYQPVCVIAYKTASESTVKSFVESMPAHRSSPVIMVYWQEPEVGNKTPISAATFKTNFEERSQWVRQAAQQAKAQGKDLSYVKVAMDSATSEYGPGGRGSGCAYFPPASDVDYYLADVYEHKLTGLQGTNLQAWSQCVAEKGHGQPQGIAEYGLGVCTATGGPATEAEREQTLAGDAAYLAKNFPHLLLWEYWWSTVTGSPHNPCAGHGKFPANSVTATEWRKLEAGTVAS